ncbi:MAG TPA: hypothetical protein VF665_01295 [Longimicrobium sp.]|jgi:hypothetical protein|uniref:hypothetical protein n=1 Tax=Longimicrobium sp. TaxID=2029185 RepID=UPI002ED7EA9A
MRRRNLAAGQSLEIVYGPMHQSWHARELLPGLHELVESDPRAAVPELHALIEREPLPMLFNWLSAAYTALGDREAVDVTIRENYRRNPQYLFARVNYAELCIASGDLDSAREALGGTLEIRALLGARKRVHISELRAYLYAVGLYHIEAGDVAAVEAACRTLERFDPDDPVVGVLKRGLRRRQVNRPAE